MSEAVAVEFFGGPLDGQRAMIPRAEPQLSFPWVDLTREPMLGEHIYDLSPRYKIPPLRYDFRAPLPRSSPPR